MIRLLLAHSGPLMRAGMRSALAVSQWVEIVAEVSRGENVLTSLQATRPHAVLMAWQLDGALDGIEVVQRIRALDPRAPVIALSSRDDAAAMCRMFQAGAAGCISERASPRAVLDALEASARGQRVWTAKQVEELTRWQTEIGSRLDALTPRECQVLELIAEGLGNRQIAERLVLSENTVQIHVRNVLGKLGVHNRLQAAVLFLGHGWRRAGQARG